ncbi:MAG: hypothetical protein OEY49_09385, partial [Candidatus Heimdallarchaeota archaeon]|nr:hypothetical protein [Candidatus Heimdallarchaeota archaeon]
MLLALIMCLVATSIIHIRTKTSPLMEIKLLAIGFYFFSIAYICFLPTTILNSPSETKIAVDETGLLFFKIATGFITIGLFLILLGIYLPSFQLSYKSISFLILIIYIFVGSLVFNFQINQYMIGERLYIEYPFFTSLFISLSQGTVFSVIIWRIIRIKKILQSKESIFLSNTTVFLVLFFGITSSLAISIPSLYPNSVFPTFTNNLIIIFLFFHFAYAFYHDTAFLFVEAVKFQGVVICSKNSGMVYFSKSYVLDLPSDHLLSALLTSYNISLNSLVGNLETNSYKVISYQDRVFQIYSGN